MTNPVSIAAQKAAYGPSDTRRIERKSEARRASAKRKVASQTYVGLTPELRQRIVAYAERLVAMTGQPVSFSTAMKTLIETALSRSDQREANTVAIEDEEPEESK